MVVAQKPQPPELLPREQASAPDSAEASSADVQPLPIARYDQVGGKQLIPQLSQLSQVELAAVEPQALAVRAAGRAQPAALPEGQRTLPGYDALDSDEIVGALADADAATIKAVRSYERHHRDRRDVRAEVARVIHTGRAVAQGARGSSWPRLQRQQATGRGQPLLAGRTGPRDHGARPAQVVELVEAPVAPLAEDLKHVLAAAAVALRRARGGGVHGYSLGGRRAIASATASGRKLPPSSTQRTASSRAWARIASRRANRASTRPAIRSCVRGRLPSAATSRGLINWKPAISASSPTGSSGELQPGQRLLPLPNVARQEFPELREGHVLRDDPFAATGEAFLRPVADDPPAPGYRLDVSSAAALLARRLNGDRQLE